MAIIKQDKFLIVAPAWVGDMVMAQVFFKVLRQQYPNAVIDVIAPSSSRALLAFMPEVNNAIALDIPHKKFGFWERYRLGKQLRGRQYEHAILLTNSWKSALVPFFAHIPVRTSWLGEQRFGLLNDWRRLDKTKWPLMIQRFAALAFPKEATLPTELPYPQLQIEPAKLALSLQQADLEEPSQPILALCPGAEYGPAKRWPAEHYAGVAKQKLSEGWQVWLFGSPKEADAGDVIQSITNNQCINLIGKTKLSDAINLLSLATAVVCNDSGLMHIAAALKRPLVAVYGSSSPRFTPPLSQQAKVLSLNLECSPCFQRECPLGHLNCLKQLLPEQVLQAVAQLIT